MQFMLKIFRPTESCSRAELQSHAPLVWPSRHQRSRWTTRRVSAGAKCAIVSRLTEPVPFTSSGGYMQYGKMLTRVILASGCAIALVFAAQAVRTPASAVALMATGNVGIKSAGALTFGPDAVLFVGDSTGGAIAAIDTDDRTPARG